ncbi:pyridoxamine 5'-phosphate oxidase family protein [Christensenella minuta]|uniref:pyridoxamine 5'-phosphate oxidase family protein n=1 Tax=Christensenella minuta TaxID=626937 RepID=UPI00215740F0|nr:pyridoxamine 5'-phosphate oxidase family protein [Christensenella minuta]
MQHRMKTHLLEANQIEALLLGAQTGCIATVNLDGTPYVTPIHFVYQNGMIYFHGLPKGQKIDNIKANPSISMTVYEMDSLLLDPDGRPCDTNTKYQSVIITGTAHILDDIQQKKDILTYIVQKYTPHLEKADLPNNMVKGTAVVEIKIQSITGKYYD